MILQLLLFILLFLVVVCLFVLFLDQTTSSRGGPPRLRRTTELPLQQAITHLALDNALPRLIKFCEEIESKPGSPRENEFLELLPQIVDVVFGVSTASSRELCWLVQPERPGRSEEQTAFIRKNLIKLLGPHTAGSMLRLVLQCAPTERYSFAVAYLPLRTRHLFVTQQLHLASPLVAPLLAPLLVTLTQRHLHMSLSAAGAGVGGASRFSAHDTLGATAAAAGVGGVGASHPSAHHHLRSLPNSIDMNDECISLSMFEYYLFFFALHAFVRVPLLHPLLPLPQEERLAFRRSKSVPEKKKKAEAVVPSIYHQLLLLYLVEFCPHNVSGPTYTKAAAATNTASAGAAGGRGALANAAAAGETFLHVFVEFWLGQNMLPGTYLGDPYGTFTLEDERPPTLDQLQGILVIVQHLLSDPLAKPRVGAAAAAPVPAVHSALAILRLPLYGFLRSSLWFWQQRLHEFKSANASELLLLVEVLLAVLRPWAAARRLRDAGFSVACADGGGAPTDTGWTSYIANNLPFYQLLVVFFQIAATPAFTTSAELFSVLVRVVQVTAEDKLIACLRDVRGKHDLFVRYTEYWGADFQQQQQQQELQLQQQQQQQQQQLPHAPPHPPPTPHTPSPPHSHHQLHVHYAASPSTPAALDYTDFGADACEAAVITLVDMLEKGMIKARDVCQTLRDTFQLPPSSLPNFARGGAGRTRKLSEDAFASQCFDGDTGALTAVGRAQILRGEQLCSNTAVPYLELQAQPDGTLVRCSTYSPSFCLPAYDDENETLVWVFHNVRTHVPWLNLRPLASYWVLLSIAVVGVVLAQIESML